MTTSHKILAVAVVIVMGPVLLVVIVFVPGSENPCVGVYLGPSGQGVNGPTGITLAGLGEAQLRIARDMVAIGKQRGAAESVILAELMAGSTESGYRNFANMNVPESLAFPHDAVGSDHDSVGPHQMRVSVWGRVGIAKLMDPVYQINWFYDHAAAVPGYQRMDPAALAQAVEISAPNAYSGSAPLARQLYDAFRDVPAGSRITSEAPQDDCGGGTAGSGVVPGGPFGANVVAAAMRWRGTPYAWGGGTPDGPSNGIRDGGVADVHGDYAKTGFDCSGLVLYAVAQASGKRILLPHLDQAQIDDPHGQAITDPSALQPGDIIQPHPGHIVIWLGNNQVIEAPQSGDIVKISQYTPSGSWKARRFG